MILFCNGKKGFCYEADCSGEKCPHYNGTGGYYVKTNGEQIRAMNDAELADWIMHMFTVCSCCAVCDSCENPPPTIAECAAHVREWLQQPVEEKKPTTGYDDKEVSGLLDD